jgi:hypothetical protein
MPTPATASSRTEWRRTGQSRLALNLPVMRPWVMVVHPTCALETPRPVAARSERSGRPSAGVWRIVSRLAACRYLLDRPQPGE